MLGGSIVRSRRRRTRAVEHPRWRAGHHPTDNRAEAPDLLVALPVAEPNAPRLPIVAVAPRATARGPRTRSAAGPAAAATRSALGVAVEVIPRRAPAELGAVDLPPPGRNRARRAPVLTGEGAAELGVTVTAQRTTRTPLTLTPTHRCIRGGGPKDELGGRCRESGRRQCRPTEKSAASRSFGQVRTIVVTGNPIHRPFHQGRVHDAVVLARARRTAAATSAPSV